MFHDADRSGKANNRHTPHSAAKNHPFRLVNQLWLGTNQRASTERRNFGYVSNSTNAERTAAEAGQRLPRSWRDIGSVTTNWDA
jgi:hypothetical protein